MQEKPYSTWYWRGERARHSLCRSPGIDPAALMTTSSSPTTESRAPSTWVCEGRAGAPGGCGANASVTMRSHAVLPRPYSAS